jgi:phosphate transport system substrate-binding protein
VTLSLSKRIGALTLLAAVAVGACSSPGASTAPTTAGTSNTPATAAPVTAAPLSGEIKVDGSSTVFPLSAAIGEDFILANPTVKVPVGFAGTGGGFKKFCNADAAEHIVVSDASRPIKTADTAEAKSEATLCKEAGIDWVELEVAIDGLSVVVNTDNSFASCLTIPELKLIYGPDSPEHLLWSEVRAGFPAEEVKRFMPGADSGTFDYFTEVVNGKVDESTQWATQSENDNELVTGVAGNTYGVAYFGFSYYIENTDKLKALEIDGGSGCIAPTVETINNGTYAPLSRPLFIYVDTKAAKTRPELKAFIDYYLANAPTIAPDIDFIPLPADKAAAELAEWNAAVGG